jgi:transmembrane sensor
MSDREDPEVLSELECEALEHVQRLMSGAASRESLEAAKRWQSLSPAHAEAIALARRMWTRLGSVGPEFLQHDAELVSRERRAATRMRATRRAFLGGAAAAAAGAVGYAVVVRPPLELWPSLAELTADYHTATGEQRQVTLADGLSIDLNTQTSVATLAGNDNRRRVELIRGEAVISADNSPLEHIVQVGDGRISFRDASVDVRYDGRASCTITCLQGSARVERFRDAVELRPDQAVGYDDTGLSASRPIDQGTVTAWQKGVLIFHQRPLSEVIAEINRYRRGRIVLLNAALGRRTVNARFTIDDVDDIMVLARREFGATVTALPGGVVLLT